MDCTHVGDECLAHLVDGLDVELEALVPLGLGAVEDRALVHVAGAVEQHVYVLKAQLGIKYNTGNRITFNFELNLPSSCPDYS